jgi:hypothetical protein
MIRAWTDPEAYSSAEPRAAAVLTPSSDEYTVAAKRRRCMMNNIVLQITKSDKSNESYELRKLSQRTCFGYK